MSETPSRRRSDRHRSRSSPPRHRSLSSARHTSRSKDEESKDGHRRSLSKKRSPSRDRKKSLHEDYYIQGSHADFTPPSATVRSRSKETPPPKPTKKGVWKTAVGWYKAWRWDDETRKKTSVALRVRRDALLQLSDAGLTMLAQRMKEPRLRRRFLLDGNDKDNDLEKERHIAQVLQKTYRYLPRLADFNRKDQGLLRGIFYDCTTTVHTADVVPMFIGGRCDCVQLRTKNKKAAVYVLNDAAAKEAFLVRNKKYGFEEEVGECTPFDHEALFDPVKDD